uniref:Uncharacterized protein n=1 Tax=Megaselia scalaris TaxID=36166 RepID=T1GKL5_MEGSC
MVEETVETMSYILFVYQEELRRKKARVIRLSKQKLQLTEKLVMRNSNIVIRIWHRPNEFYDD